MDESPLRSRAPGSPGSIGQPYYVHHSPGPVELPPAPQPIPAPASPLAHHHHFSPHQPGSLPLAQSPPLADARLDLSPALHRDAARNAVVHERAEMRHRAMDEIQGRLAAIRDGVVDSNLATVQPVGPGGLLPEGPVEELEGRLRALREREFGLKTELDQCQSEIARVEAALGRVGLGPSIPQPVVYPEPGPQPQLYAPAPITGQAAQAVAKNYAIATAREWVAVLDPARNRHYYWNPATAETTWTLPPDGVLRPQP